MTNSEPAMHSLQLVGALATHYVEYTLGFSVSNELYSKIYRFTEKSERVKS